MYSQRRNIDEGLWAVAPRARVLPKSTHVRIYVVCKTQGLFDYATEYFAAYPWAIPVLVGRNQVLQNNVIWAKLHELLAEWETCNVVGTLSISSYKTFNPAKLSVAVENQDHWMYYHFADCVPEIGNQYPQNISKPGLPVLPTEQHCLNWMCRPSYMLQFVTWFKDVQQKLILKNPGIMSGEIRSDIQPMVLKAQEIFREVFAPPPRLVEPPLPVVELQHEIPVIEEPLPPLLTGSTDGPILQDCNPASETNIVTMITETRDSAMRTLEQLAPPAPLNEAPRPPAALPLIQTLAQARRERKAPLPSAFPVARASTVLRSLKTLILYTYSRDSSSSRYFFEHGIFEHPDYYFLVIAASSTLASPTMKAANVAFVKRKLNTWASILSDRWKEYDRFVFVSDATIGPFRHSERPWPENLTEKLTSTARIAAPTVTLDTDGRVSLRHPVFACDREMIALLMYDGFFATQQLDISKRLSSILWAHGWEPGYLTTIDEAETQNPLLLARRLDVRTLVFVPSTIKIHPLAGIEEHVDWIFKKYGEVPPPPFIRPA